MTSLLSWGLSLIFSGLLVREMAHRMKALDYRAAGAAAYLGLGVTWAMGPFWMLPLLGVLKLRARALAGYGMLQLLVLLPIVFFLC